MPDFKQKIEDAWKETVLTQYDKNIPQPHIPAGMNTLTLQRWNDWIIKLSDADLKEAKIWLMQIKSAGPRSESLAGQFLMALIDTKKYESNPDMIEIIGKLFADIEINIDRENLVVALGEQGHAMKAVAPYLVQALQAWVEKLPFENWGWTQTKTIEALGKIGDARALPILEKVMKEVVEPPSMFEEYCQEAIALLKKQAL